MAKRSFIQTLGLLDSDAFDSGASRTLTEQTYNDLRTDIVEGRLLPGSKLRIEHLRQRYQVGAGTLREALTRLVSDALVTAEGQRGFRVSPIAMDDLRARGVNRDTCEELLARITGTYRALTAHPEA